MAELGVNGQLTMGVIDTGAHQTVMDTRMAAGLGLPIVAAEGADCGLYAVAGGQLLAYAGRVA